jgi:putative nucleotidyltransferase-like protein
MLPQPEVDARIARYHATLDARALWPEVSAAAFRAAQEEIARATAAVFADGARPVPLTPPPGTDAHVLGIAAYIAGMGPLLGWWCETGRVVADPTLADVLALQLDYGRRRAARLRAELGPLLGAFASRGVAVTVLKGADTAYRYFPDPGARPHADIDLLVRPEHRVQARATLLELGFREDATTVQLGGGHWSPPSPQRVRSFELTHPDDPWQVDLHATLDRILFHGLNAGFGVPGPSELEMSPWLPRPVGVLREPLLFAFLAFHASRHFHFTQLLRLVELVLVARRDFAGRPEAWAAFWALVTRTRTGRFVYPSLELAERLVPGTVDPEIRRRLADETPARLRRLVARTTPATAHRVYRQPVEKSSLWIATPRELLAYLGHVVWPRDGDDRLTLREFSRVQRLRLRRVLHSLVRANRLERH